MERPSLNICGQKMCGICGFNWEDKYLIKKMTDVIYHRGPDKEGFFIGDGISLGNRRLSIIDLSEKGTQPIYNEDKSICITYDGKVYNFQEMKLKLEDKGHRFLSHTDTEVVVHAYEEYGLECLQKFNGMFSFALWDSKRKRLFLARDRIGIKPLYYYYNTKFIFASEIKAILQDKNVERRINHQALYYYLGYEFIPAPMTMFENILKLPPGHYLLYEKGKIKITKYWDLKFFSDKKETTEFYKEGIVELLNRSVKRRLISDVPLGVFLSGGLDSSTVVAFIRRNITGPLKTFSIGYKDKTYSELDYAKKVARYFDTEHKILMIDSVTPDDIEKTLWHLDEPMTDLSTIPFYMICKKARNDVIVVLSGEGGDEVFVGYDRFKASKVYNLLYRLLPRDFRDYIIAGLIKRLPDQPQKKGIVNIMKRFAQGAALPEDGSHMRWQYFSNPEQDEKLYLNSFKKGVVFDPFSSIRESISCCNSTDRLNQEIYIDIRFTMPDSALMKVDKMSMATSLEVRVPFLDHELIEFSARIPSSLKLKGFTTKAIFREAIRDFLPSHIVKRGKQGYSFPSKNWLREQLKDYMIELLNNSSLIKENLNLEYVRTIMKQHLARTHNHNHILWALINLAVWHNKFFA